MIAAMTCAAPVAAADEAPAVIPAPKRLTAGDGGPFVIDPGKTVIVASDPSLVPVAEYASEALSPALGHALKTTQQPIDNVITLKLDPKLPLNDEGYTLVSTAAGVTITGRTPAGVFYGVQTLRQLLPVAAFDSRRNDILTWTVPAVQIEDEPRFAWRGLHLDVARHFFSVDEVKHFIDLLALHKFNTFHWHLTDDQGWRIEIKKYPKLTDVGAWRSGIGFGLDPKAGTAWGPDGRYGGFYTQQQVRDVVAYAKTRFVNVVPEIEMPGHSVAALAAYPELSCSGKPFSTDITAGVHDGVLCASNPRVDQFITDVLDETLALFPSTVIHVGGDEVPKGPWKQCERCQAYMKQKNLKDENELQSDFIRRADRYLTSRGRRLIGWDEILEGGLAEGATVMSWRGVDGGIAAAKAGHDVVMSPGSHCYLDHYQGDPETQPKAIGGYTPLVRVYAYEPVPPELTEAEAKHVLGAQANLWAEYFPNYRHVQYMAWPRACALAEVTWSAKEARDYDDFTKRLRRHYERLDAMDVNYYKGAIDDPPPVETGRRRRGAYPSTAPTQPK